MKNRSLLVAGLALLSLSAIIVFSPLLKKLDPRSAYERHLLKVSKSIPMDEAKSSESEDESEEEARLDRPDIAAYTDYIKTMDPSTGAIPLGRLQHAFDQTQAMQTLKTGRSSLTWTNRVSNMGGRTRVIFNDPNDPLQKKVWAGSVTGGLWFNNDAYANEEWHPADDFWPGLAVACMASDPINKNIYYVGTGESQTALRIYRESSSRGVGIMKSLNQGQTWELIPSTKDWAYVTDILVRNENGQSVIYAGVVSGIYKGKTHESSPGDGLYRSVNDGQSWEQVLPVISGGTRPFAPSDIETSADGSRLFVGTTYHGQDQTGAACILYSDNGTQWSVMDDYYNKLTQTEVWERNHYPYSHPGRVMLANAPSDPNIIYAIIAGGFNGDNNFVYYTDRYLLKSIDKGVTWNEIPSPFPLDAASGTLANLAWHAMIISVDPGDPNTIWMGGLDVWRTRNSGANWQKLSYWAPRNEEQGLRFVHADIHMIKFRPENPSELLIGTDGGLFYTNQAAAESPVFERRNRAYSTLQYYYGAIHPEAGRQFYVGGLQDNGSLLDADFSGQPIISTLSGGDGFYCFIDEDQPDMLISTIYYTYLNLISFHTPQTARPLSIINYGNGTFCNPMDYDWRYNILYANGCGFAGQNANTLRVVRVSDRGLTPDRSVPPLAIPTQSPVPYSCIKWNVNSGQDESTLYIGTEAGRLYRLAQAPVLGELTDMTSAALPVAYISSIDIGQTEDTLMVTYSNYGVPSVFITVDGGASWMNVEANLPDMPVRWGIFHPKNSRQVMLATEIGIWTTNDIFAQQVTWTPDVQGMANVRVDMVKFRTSDNTVLAATHGRGMFTATWNPVYSSSSTGQIEMTDMLKVYPNPSKGKFEVSIDHPENSKLTIMDIAGKVILQEQIREQQGRWQKAFDLSGQSKGIFIVKVSTGQKNSMARLVLE
ncbi:MAG: T9SS type A sorting domain-containing protein [Bacteroidales bacterium]